MLFGSASILPNLLSSVIVAGASTLLTHALRHSGRVCARAPRVAGQARSGFYILATQMLPPVGLIIPYYLVLQKIGGLDTYGGLIVIYLTFSLPFAIWLMVSYFEDIPREMEEAALLDRAGRLRTLWYVILPQVRGGIAVTTIFVFLNAWNEFLFAVVLGGNRVRPVTVAMFNFISVEQTLWAKLAAGAMLAMAPVILLGLLAQRHIVKGLTVGAVKGGGRDERRRAASSACAASSSGTARSPRCMASTSTSSRANSSRCSGRRDPARRRRCASSPASRP